MDKDHTLHEGGRSKQEKASSYSGHEAKGVGAKVYVCSDAEQKARDGAESFEAVFGQRVDWPTAEEIAACDVDSAVMAHIL